MNLHTHRVDNIELTKIKQLSGGSYTRDIVIESEKETVTVEVYSDNKEELEVKVK